MLLWHFKKGIYAMQTILLENTQWYITKSVLTIVNKLIPQVRLPQVNQGSVEPPTEILYMTLGILIQLLMYVVIRDQSIVQNLVDGI